MQKTRSIAASVLTFSIVVAVGRAASSEDWPQWRGPNRDGKSLETGLLKEWPADGPQVVWQSESAGVGYSTVAVKDGRVITQGDLDGVEHIIAFSEEDGSLLWAVQPKQVAEALKARVDGQFAQADKNGDGRLDELEAMSGLGWNFNHFDAESDGDKTEIARKRVAALLKQIDRNGDGKLDDKELPAAMLRERSRIDSADKNADQDAVAESRTKAIFERADKNGDGKISKNETRGSALAFVFFRADERLPGSNRGDGQLTKEELIKYFSKREPGRDGIVTTAELQEYYVRTFPGRDGVLVKSDVLRYYGGYRNGAGDGPRGTPTIDGDRLYAEGGNGDLTCLEAATGKTIWHLNLVADLKGGRPGWGYSESPLVVGDLLIVTPGGDDGTIAALNKQDGSVVWRSDDVKQQAQYSSPVVAEIAGIKQVVQFAYENVFGVTLKAGDALWSYSRANNRTANVTTPIIAGDHVLASSAYGRGSGLVKISNQAGKRQQADEVYFQNKLANHHGGLVKVGEDVYGFGRGLMCMDFLTGEIVWQDRSVGKGSLVYADGMLYCLGERYQMALVEATPDEYREHGRFKIDAFGRPSWPHPVVANGRLYIRNQHQLTAYDVKQ